MKYNPKHLRSIQALPADRRITVFLKRGMLFLESLVNTCDVFSNSVALQVDQRVRPTCELLVGLNFFEEMRSSQSTYLQGEYDNPTDGDRVATFNSWDVYYDNDYSAGGHRLPFVGPDGAFFLVVATASKPDHQILLGSVAFVLEGKGKA